MFSTDRAPKVARKVTEVDGREDDKDDAGTEIDWSLGSIITKAIGIPSSTFHNVSKVILKHVHIANLNHLLQWMPCILADQFRLLISKEL